MPANQLVRDRAQRIGDCEAPFIGFNLSKEDTLEEQITDLSEKILVVGSINCVEHLVGFLEHKSTQRLNRLLSIPRAAVRSAQARHDVDELLKLASAGAVRQAQLRIASLKRPSSRRARTCGH